jgi:anaerobic selenocysteine-containing dehydrogenase
MSNYDEFLATLDRKAYHEGEFTWEEDGFQVYRSYPWSAPGCHNSCGCLFYLDNEGRLDHVEGDPLSPYANGKLCMRCLDMPEATNHPNRLKYPLKRIGARGEDKWERISWDEALDTIVEKARYYRDTYGPQTIMVARGTGRNIGIASALQAFVGYESPMCNTIFNIGYSCYGPRVQASRAIYGDYWIVDASVGHEDRYANKEWKAPGVIIVWAVESLKSNADGYIGHWLVECMQMGTKVISVDPRLTWWGARAEHWLQVRPGTDIALGMAMLNVIINEDLYNHEFVEMWCYGFEELASSVAEMTPEKAAEICQIDAEEIRNASRLWAQAGSGAVQWGLPLEQQDTDCLAANQCILALQAICGYVDCPGGALIVRDAFGVSHHLSEDLLPPGNIGLRPDKIKPDAIWGETRQTYWDWEQLAPTRVRMMIFQSCNSLANTAPDPSRLLDIWQDTLEFVVGADPFMNPTISAFADLVVPIAMGIERDTVRGWWTPLRACSKITEYYEAKDDETFGIEIINKMWPDRYPMMKNGTDLQNIRLHDSGTGENTLGDIVNAIYADVKDEDGGKTWAHHKNEYSNVRVEKWNPDIDFEKLKVDLCGYAYDVFNDTYYKYEKGILRPDGGVGFDTPSGRIELYSLKYNGWNKNPVPAYVEPHEGPISTPELYEKYPLINISGVRSYEFFHSEHRNLPTMREFHPWPLVCMNPKTAEEYGIKEGEWTWIANDRGRFKQIAHIVQGIKDGTITTEHGWWFPEDDPAMPTLFRTFDSNPNLTIDLDTVGIYGLGSAQKTTLVTIYPYKEGDISPTEQIVQKGGFSLQRAHREAYKAKWETKPAENNQRAR